MSELPARPSKEHLRKQAKRLARDKSLGLAEAQRKVAADYGASTWADLMRRVDAARGGEAVPLPPLAAAARAGDLAAVRRLIAEGQPIDDGGAKTGTPLWQACASDAPAEARMAIADALLSAGANPRHDNGGETALHAAANRGPLALVELLIRKGALEWQPDAKGRPPIAAARRGKAADKAAIIELLDRPVIRDRSFRAAVTALQQGDVAALARLLDDEPRLLSERILEPDCYREASRSQYFRDPKLFWFIANNPTLMKRMPDNIVEVAETMIARGVDKADLDYALELVMTSLPAREQGLQIPLLERLMKAGATPTAKAIDVTLAHWELAPIQALLQAGHPMTAPIAAALGRTDRLEAIAARGVGRGDTERVRHGGHQPPGRGGAAGARCRRRRQWLPAGSCPQHRPAPGRDRRESRTDGAPGRAGRPHRCCRQAVEQHAARLGDPSRQGARPGLP